MLATNLVRQCKKIAASTFVQSRRGVYWGHHTLEEQVRKFLSNVRASVVV